MGGLIGPAGVIKAITRQFEEAQRRAIMSTRMQSLITSNVKKSEDIDSQYDLVYILKEDDFNPDLVMSLRSVEKFCPYRKVWVVGYKPSWLKNVDYLPTKQTGNKWKNSELNWRAACECPDISDNFILMNDDFIALRPISNWPEELNVCLGNISEEADRWSKKAKPSRWQWGFIYAKDLLRICHARSDYNYESHMPIIINKANYLKFLEMKPIKEFVKSPKVLHKRSLYKNLFPEEGVSLPHKIKDVKILLGYDLTDGYLKENWLSVFDDVIGNALKFPKVNKFLNQMFPNKSKFEE